MRILVVEDDTLARRALRRLLEADGHTLRAVADGDRAVAVLRRFDPHLIVMDWHVPGLAGEVLCLEARRLKPGVPIVVVSSAEEAFASGIDINARLRKPLDVGQLLVALEHVGPAEGNGRRAQAVVRTRSPERKM